MIGGLCILSKLSSNFGVAGLTNFKFDISEFRAINYHLRMQLGESSAREIVYLISARLIYPDSSII